jgi:pimeloyl-ACP methyl ester carboxylesterase
MTRPSEPVVVLVHGAWHGAWCWEQVRSVLEQRGLATLVVELPSTLVDDVGFADDVAAVRSCLDGCDDPVLLVGHSYGGAVVTVAGEHPAVRGLVYVAGFNLTEDESPAAAAVVEAVDIDHTGRAELELVGAGGGRMLPTPGSARTVFLGDCPPEVAAWAIERLRAQAMSCLGASPGAVAWRSRPSTYVVCELDQAVHPDLQRILARRADRQESLPSSHSPFLSMPDRLASIVAAAAVEVSEPGRSVPDSNV